MPPLSTFSIRWATASPPTGPIAALVNGKTTDSQANKDVASVLLTPVWVTSDNMASTVVKDGAVKAADLCVADVAAACTTSTLSRTSRILPRYRPCLPLRS